MIKNCEICGKEFECYNKPNKSKNKRTKLKRPFNSKTCSKKCSKVRTRLNSSQEGRKVKNG